MNKYEREMKGLKFDVYEVLVSFGVSCPARQHAIKKLLLAGRRGVKDEMTDLEEAKQSVQRAIELECDKTSLFV